jgi:sugar phosphate isomerase/epimerase
VGYWHDAGHAEVQDQLYGIGHEALISRFSSRLVGIHLHDAKGTRDHQAPGKGKIDFEMIKKHLPPDAIRVLELSPKVTENELMEAIDFLAGIFH